MQNKMLDLVVNNPPPQLFNLTAQKMVAAGILLFFVCWGAAKIIRAWRGK